MFSLLIPLHALTRLGSAGRQASKGISGGSAGAAGYQPRPDSALGSCHLLGRPTADRAQGLFCAPHKPHSNLACPLILLGTLSPPYMVPGQEETTAPACSRPPHLGLPCHETVGLRTPPGADKAAHVPLPRVSCKFPAPGALVSPSVKWE